MEDKIEIYKGSIEEKTIHEVKYVVKEYPAFKGKIEQPFKYIISGFQDENFM